MANVDLNIVLKLIDQATADIKKSIGQQSDAVEDLRKKEKKSFEQWQKDTEKLSNELKNLGRNVSQVGNAVALFSGAILAPMILSLRNATKSSAEVSESMQRLGDISSEFQRKIAESLLPTINGFINGLTKLYNIFLSIPQPMRDTALQGLFMVGVFGVLGGVIVKLIGDVLKLASNLTSLLVTFAKFALVNPHIVLLGIALTGVLILMLKFKPVADVVLNSFQILWNSVRLLIESVKLSQQKFIESILRGVADVLSATAFIDRVHHTALTNAANDVIGLADNYGVAADRSIFEIKRLSSEMGNLITMKPGDFALNFDEGKKAIDDFIKSFSDIQTKGIEPTRQAYRQLTEDIVRQENDIRILKQQMANEDYLREFTANQNKIALLTQWRDFAMSAQVSVARIQTASLQAVNSIIDGFGNAFAQMIIEGKSFTDSMKEAFKSMASMFIAEVSKMIAKWLAFTALKAVGKFFGFGGGGFVPKFGFSEGSGYVPPLRLASGTDTVPAMLTPGEIVVPKTMSDSIRSGDVALTGGKEGKSFGDINVNVYYPKMSKEEDIRELSTMLGFEIEKQLRYSRL